MIPGYHIDKNHGSVHQSHIFDKKMVYDQAYIEQRYQKYDTVDRMNVLRLDLIKDVCGRPGSIFDYGYGNGSFLVHCHEDGIRSAGYEINTWPLPEGCMHAIADPLLRFDVFSMFDVFEHLTEDEQRSLLGNVICGHMVFSLPWCHYELGDEWFQNSYRHRRPDEHLSHWAPGSLCSLLKLYNYRPVYVGNPEDAIRKVESEWWPNILTAIFKRV